MNRTIIVLILLIGLTSGLNQTEYEKCDRVYYFIVSNNYHYTENEFNQLNCSKDYLTFHDELCYEQGYPNMLPLIDYPKMIINKSENVCDYKIDGFLGTSLPFFDIELKNCSKKLKYLFRIEEYGDDFKINGLRFYVPMLIILVVFVFTKDWG